MKDAFICAGAYFLGLMAIDAGVSVKLVMGAVALVSYFIGVQQS